MIDHGDAILTDHRGGAVIRHDHAAMGSHGDEITLIHRGFLLVVGQRQAFGDSCLWGRITCK